MLSTSRPIDIKFEAKDDAQAKGHVKERRLWYWPFGVPPGLAARNRWSPGEVYKYWARDHG